MFASFEKIRSFTSDNSTISIECHYHQRIYHHKHIDENAGIVYTVNKVLNTVRPTGSGQF